MVTHINKIRHCRIFTRDEIRRTPESRLHHAARHAKDHARAGIIRHQGIKGHSRNLGWRNLLHTQQPLQLPRRQHHIHIRHAGVTSHGIHRALALFRQAGHDGNGAELLWVYADMLRKIALDHRSKHLLRALCGRKLSHQLGITRLNKAHPARAAARKHRIPGKLSTRQPLDKLTRLLHDRQIRGKARVKYIVKANLLQCTRKPVYPRNFPGQIAVLAPRRTDGRSDLHHRHCVWIRHRRQHPVYIVTLL